MAGCRRLLALCGFLLMLAVKPASSAPSVAAAHNFATKGSDLVSNAEGGMRMLREAGSRGERLVDTGIKAAVTSAGAAAGSLSSFSVACTGETFSKQSCSLSNVCLQLTTGQRTLEAFLDTPYLDQKETLCRHLQRFFQDSHEVQCTLQPSSSSDSHRASSFQQEQRPTVLWRAGGNQESFGHDLVNEAFPMFLMLRNHFGDSIPTDLQVLVAPAMHKVLHHVLSGTVASSTQLVQDKLAALSASAGSASSSGICFQHLIVGDGGYEAASRASLSNSKEHQAHSYSIMPSFFNSHSWWMFREHTLKVANVSEPQLNSQVAASVSKDPENSQLTSLSALGADVLPQIVREQVSTQQQQRPLILLNDKRYGPDSSPDRRMILDIDSLAAEISAAYPTADVQAVRFRDLAWREQLQLLARATVFITTQGSSAFRLVWLPRGATCVMIGSPETPHTDWTSFHELDRWFPLTYIQFARYFVPYENTNEYEVKMIPGQYQPSIFRRRTRKQWNLYNASIRVKFERLKPMLDKALAAYR